MDLDETKIEEQRPLSWTHTRRSSPWPEALTTRPLRQR
jgi:hypothetical protein